MILINKIIKKWKITKKFAFDYNWVMETLLRKGLLLILALGFAPMSFADTMNLTITNNCGKPLCWQSETATFQGSITAKNLSGGTCDASCPQCIPSKGKVLLQITPSANKNDMVQIGIGNDDTGMSFIAGTGQSYCSRYYSAHINTCLIQFNSNQNCSSISSTPAFRWIPGENETFDISTAGK